MTIQLKKGQNYQATAKLNVFMKGFKNDFIMQQLKKYGFENVNVTGEGERRTATGIWGKDTVTKDAPAMLTDLKEI